MEHHHHAVVYIITKLELGGAQKVCLSLFEDIPTYNLPTYLITGTQGPLVETVRDKKNVFLLPELERELGTMSLLREVRAWWRMVSILRELKKLHPHIIVHTHSTKAGILGRWAGFIAGAHKRVHTIHGFAFHAHQPKIITAAIYLIELITSIITTQFIVVSSHDMQIGKRLFPFFARKAITIRAAVDTEKFIFKPATVDAAEQNICIIGTVACFKKQKNLGDLLTAFAKAYTENNQLRLEIIGDGVLRPEIEQFIAAHTLADVVTLHGWQEDVVPFMRRWKIFALTSLWEGLPCALVEARLLRIPIITYDTGGVRDIVKDGINGFVIAQHDHGAIASKMLLLAHDNALQQRLAQYPDALEHFSKSTMCSLHHATYMH